MQAVTQHQPAPITIGGREFAWGERTYVMGILNVTPDSFSGDGVGTDIDAAVRQAVRMRDDGADLIDVGGESTRPGAAEVPVDEEIARTVRVVEALAKHCGASISIDTRKAAVAEAALEAGARVVNDVSGLDFEPEIASVTAQRGALLVIGHARGTPETMQRSPHYDDVVAEVGDELAAAVDRARGAGVAAERIVVDPGLGFGKRPADNLALLGRVGEIRRKLGLPVLVGPSRKSFLGAITGEPVDRRDEATFAACAVAAFAGADAVRVHEPAGAVRAVAIGRAVRDAAPEAQA